MSKTSPTDRADNNGCRINGMIRNGTYHGKVGTQLKQAIQAVSSIKRQAESALAKK